MIKSIHLDNFTPFQLCDDSPEWYRADIYTFEQPFEIEPTTGKHDFNTCEGCQQNLKQIETYLTQRFEGTNERPGFPFCCPQHSHLVKEKEFIRSDFVSVPNMVARKAIYTRQHIINNHHLDNWYMVITDYILWAIESFGSMPKGCGEPLYLSIYRHFIIDDLKKDDTEIPLEKRRKLLDFFDTLRNQEKAANTDINVLIVDEKVHTFK